MPLNQQDTFFEGHTLSCSKKIQGSLQLKKQDFPVAACSFRKEVVKT